MHKLTSNKMQEDERKETILYSSRLTDELWSEENLN